VTVPEGTVIRANKAKETTMAFILVVHFSDGYQKIFSCQDDEEALMKRNDLLEAGFQDKNGDTHVYYPAHSIVKIVTTKE